jgi:hypothetical protein
MSPASFPDGFFREQASDETSSDLVKRPLLSTLAVEKPNSTDDAKYGELHIFLCLSPMRICGAIQDMWIDIFGYFFVKLQRSRLQKHTVGV